MKTCRDLYLKFRLEKSNWVDIEKSGKFPGVCVCIFSLTYFFYLNKFSWFVSRCPRGCWLSGARMWGAVEALLGDSRAGPRSQGLSHCPSQGVWQAGAARATPASGISGGCQPAVRTSLVGHVAGLGRAVGSWGRVWCPWGADVGSWALGRAGGGLGGG